MRHMSKGFICMPSHVPGYEMWVCDMAPYTLHEASRNQDGGVSLA